MVVTKIITNFALANIKYRDMDREMYDKICRILTEYENPDDFENFDEYNSINWEEKFYNLLVEIQNESPYA